MNVSFPRPRSGSLRWLGVLMVLLAAGCFSPAAVPAEKREKLTRAVELYDAGNYAEAHLLLDALVAEGQADGPTLYRLYYCQREAGDAAARDTLLKARTALEAELPSAKRLDIPFYLANVYRNTARLSDAKRVATETTSRFEKGKLKKPRDGMGMFQLGKLYADQEDADRAGQWYKKAIKAFADSGEKTPPSAQWAARYLGDQAFEAGDWTGVEENLGALLAAETATVKDLDRLAKARIESGNYKEANNAWNRAANLNPAEGDHPRYCARLARQAQELGTLPEKAPDGRPWPELAPADLEALMSERVAAAMDELAKATPPEAIDDARAQEIEAAVVEHREVFVRAALEYARRDLPIRETAFRAGYAPMIFHSRRWRLPPR